MNKIEKNSYVEFPQYPEQFEDTVGKKIARVAFHALAWVVVALGVITVLPGLIVSVQKVRSHLRLKDAIDEMAKERYKAVHKALKDIDGAFGKEINELKNMVAKESPPKGDVHAYMQTFRSKLDSLLAEPGSDSNEVLQTASHVLNSESPGMKPMQAIGKKAVGSCGQIGYGALANKLESAIKKETIFKKNTLMGQIFWIAAHPQKFLESALDQKGISDPLSYNSFEHGNASVHVGTFDVGRTKYSLSQSPTFVADGLTEAGLKFGTKRLVQDLEEPDSGHKGEKGRVNKKLNIANQYPRNLIYRNTPMNLKKGNVAPEIELDQTLKRAVDTAFAYDDTLPEKRHNQAKHLALVSLKALEEMVAHSGKNETIYLNQSCKQNIDRGVIVNVMTILFADIAGGVKLSEERVHQVVGMTVCRAGMVDDRAILKKWSTSLFDLLRLMEQKPELAGAVRSHFKNSNIAFNASGS